MRAQKKYPEQLNLSDFSDKSLLILVVLFYFLNAKFKIITFNDLIPILFEKNDIHVHVPEGATPKDGPSAGIAMFTAIVSAFSGVPIKNNIAMTGEITLRGRVLPIGGLKEKILAAHRGGVNTVLIPQENEKDLADIPKEVLKDIDVISVSHMDDVIPHAIVSDESVLKDVSLVDMPLGVEVSEAEKPLNLS